MANREEVIMVSLVHLVICPNVEWKAKNPFKARRFCGVKEQEVCSWRSRLIT
jgi:hypothetical protein